MLLVYATLCYIVLKESSCIGKEMIMKNRLALLLALLFALSLPYCTKADKNDSGDKADKNYIDAYKNGYDAGKISLSVHGVEGAKAIVKKNPKEKWVAGYIEYNPDGTQDSHSLKETASGWWDGLTDAMLEKPPKY